MKLINWSRIFAVILVLASLTACGGSGGSGGSYSNSTLAGNWIITEASRSFYLSAKENGRTAGNWDIAELSRINLTRSTGTYSVGSDGSLAFLACDAVTGECTRGSGRLFSSTAGTITIDNIPGTMSKVTDVAACQGHYSGTISKSGTSNNISFDVDISGAISNFLSDSPFMDFISGKAYAIGNNAVMLLKTNSDTDIISAWGTLGNGHFTGLFHSFAPDISVTGTISLVKS